MGAAAVVLAIVLVMVNRPAPRSDAYQLGYRAGEDIAANPPFGNEPPRTPWDSAAVCALEAPYALATVGDMSDSGTEEFIEGCTDALLEASGW